MDTPQTRRSFHYSFGISSKDTVWIHPRHDSHSITPSDSSNQIQTRYAPYTEAILFPIQIQLSTSDSDTLQTRTPFFYSYRSQLQIQSRYALDTVAICDTVGELTWDFCICVRKCFSLARVATDFLFYPKERFKKHNKKLLRCFLGFGE